LEADMGKLALCRERCQSREEEVANSISHGIGLVLALVATPILIRTAARHGDPGYIVGVSIFVGSMLILYLASTVYHAWPDGNTKSRLRRIEHSAIFILIAGTYTPFTLGVLRDTWGWALFVAVWSLAAIGIRLTLLGRDRRKTLLYLGMGWLIVVAIVPLWRALGSSGVLWLAAGGAAYTLGVVFFAASQVRYAHFVWHLFVLTGTACHAVAVQAYGA
jgi:hemolysin III